MQFVPGNEIINGTPYPEWEGQLTADFDPTIARAMLTDPESGFRVLNILSDPLRPAPGTMAYSMATYSRHGGSIDRILRRVANDHDGANKKIEDIAESYGHKSVMDLAQIALAFERVPLFLALSYWYRLVVGAGQEVSTRYQSLEKTSFVELPPNLEISPELREEFQGILRAQMANYSMILPMTYPILESYWHVNPAIKEEVDALKARNFDIARHLLPQGILTNFGIIASARHWSAQIGLSRASGDHVDRTAANMIYSLMVTNSHLRELGYPEEAPGLIRHSGASYQLRDSTALILDGLRGSQANRNLNVREASNGYQVGHYGNPDHGVLLQYLLLIDPNLSRNGFERFIREMPSDLIERTVGEAWAKHHNRFYEIFHLGDSGAITATGYSDLGTIHDFIRHRSLKRNVPLLHDTFDFRTELNRAVPLFAHCAYTEALPELAGVRSMMDGMLNRTYSQIIAWYEKAFTEQGPEFANNYVRYLLPKAHLTRYSLSGSHSHWQYFINQRSGYGGHINYRMDAKKIADGLMQYGALRPSMSQVVSPDPQSRAEAMGRS